LFLRNKNSVWLRVQKNSHRPNAPIVLGLYADYQHRNTSAAFGKSDFFAQQQQPFLQEKQHMRQSADFPNSEMFTMQPSLNYIAI
jgi:hypothetical protein